MTDPALQALLDKQEITELLTRYLRSVDRGDVATLRSCYLPGATEDHGGLFAGPAEEYVDSVAAAMDKVIAQGGEIVQPIGADAPEITARFRDPAGNVLGLYQHPS